MCPLTGLVSVADVPEGTGAGVSAMRVVAKHMLANTALSTMAVVRRHLRDQCEQYSNEVRSTGIHGVVFQPAKFGIQKKYAFNM